MSSTSTRRSYSAGHFLMTIDGLSSTPSYLKSVEGGFVKLNSSDVQHGADVHRVKHTTTREQESFTVEIGLSEVNPLLVWIAKSWNSQDYEQHTGHVVHADFDYKAQFYHYFYDALIEETAMPTFDAGSKEPLFMKVKIRPQRIDLRPGDGLRIAAPQKPTQKLLTSSSFRLVLDGFDTRFVNKIEGFTIKQGIKPLTSGRTQTTQMAEIIPTKIDFPDLKIHMSMSHAGEILDWYNRVVVRGESISKNETTGHIEILTPDRKREAARINLEGVGIKGFTLPKSEGNQAQVKRCSFDLYVSGMTFESDDARFLLI